MSPAASSAQGTVTAAAPLPSPAVQVNDVSQSFGDHRVLDHVNLQVERGETLALLGRSGTGKSVLLKLIVGLQHADAGCIRIFGTEITTLTRKPLQALRRKIGFLFQSAALYDSMSLEDNVAFPLRRHAHLSDADLRSRVRELLAQVGMEKDLHKSPAQISGGMQKRVGLARALALAPDLMLFDEPTAGLDPITAAEIGTLIQDLQRERRVAAIVVTHDVPVARAIADRVALLHEGRILFEGGFAQLQASQDPFVTRFLNPLP